MNSIQKYVLNSLFVRNQITEEKLAQALDTFSNEPAIDAFLSTLNYNWYSNSQITSNQSTKRSFWYRIKGNKRFS